MKLNPWPCMIIGYFAVFISAMAGWIAFAMRNDQELVRPDYYEHEITFQKQLDTVARTSAIRSQLSLIRAGSSLSLTLPAGRAEGEIHLYRPSNSKLDRKFQIQTDAFGRQTVDLSGMAPGYWKVLVSWNAAGKDYYFDQPLILGP